jgi:multiple antibiotic resistance protein
MKALLFSLITLLLALDPLGLIPLYLEISQEAEEREILKASVATAFGVGIGVLILGKGIFKVVGITMADFQVAGGLLLLALSLRDLLGQSQVQLQGDLGVVPLGTPLMAGPATITALLVCQNLYGFWITVLAYLATLALTYFILRHCWTVVRIMGTRGARALARVTSLFLAAFAVSFIRRGLVSFLGNSP